MIQQQSRIEFGHGDVRIRCVVFKGKGILVLDNQQLTAIGDINCEPGMQISLKEINQAPFVLSFENKASIDAVRFALDCIYELTT